MPETIEHDEVTVAGEIYRIAHMVGEEGHRITISSKGQLRFSLPADTPDEQVQRFIQVYALGFVDGQGARPAGMEGHIRERLIHVAQRLGHAVGRLKVDPQ